MCNKSESLKQKDQFKPRDLLDISQKQLENGNSVCLIHKIPENNHIEDAEHSSASLNTDGLCAVVSSEGKMYGNCPESVISEARKNIDKRRTKIVSEGEAEYFLDTLSIPSKLILFGGGHVARAIAPLALNAGFQVTVCDNRDGFAVESYFPECSHFTGSYLDFISNLSVDLGTYIIILTHGHTHDLECLREVIHLPSAYLGMIGSKAKVAHCYNQLAEEGVEQNLFERIHAPVGLDIGAETPEEIAVSIIAEIIAARSGRHELSCSMKADYIPAAFSKSSI